VHEGHHPGAVGAEPGRARTTPPAGEPRRGSAPSNSVRFPQGHHLYHWANGGPTRLDNLALLCGRHHRAVHEDGYTVVRDPDGTLRFSTPGGWPIPDVPPSPAVPRDPAQALVATNRAHGLAIDARTGLPSWCGERLNLGWAIDVLHPACQPAAPRQDGE
jgi:HNH endonuclease